MSWLVGLIFAWVVAAVILIVVDRLNIGLKVNSFGSALIAALVIAILALVTWPILEILQLPFTGLPLGMIEWVIGWIFSAAVLYFAAKILRGIEILNFPSALVVALVLGILTWLTTWVMSLF
jgi:putative membrane protein